MHFLLLGTLLFAFSLATDIPTLDLRNGIHSDTFPQLKVQGKHRFFRILVTENTASTGYKWFDLRNPKSNCIPLVELRGKSVIRTAGPHLMGQSHTEVWTYETKFLGKQEILLVYSRTKPDTNKYDDVYNKIGRETYPIIIDIGSNEAKQPCQA